MGTRGRAWISCASSCSTGTMSSTPSCSARSCGRSGRCPTPTTPRPWRTRTTSFSSSTLAADARFRGAMLIATQDVPQAVKEIDRIGRHPAIVEVLVANGARLPYGNRYYHPIFEACEALGLPFALHTGSEGVGINGQPSVAGYGSYYVENRQVRPQGY